MSMKSAVVFIALLGLALGNIEDELFPRYDADGNHCMDQNEWSNFWLHFDLNGDGHVTKMEFDTTWQREDFNDKERAPLFFLELDRNYDSILNDVDFNAMFNFFDENGNSCITSHEFRFNWNALFNN